ncbi:JmjC domain-containing protein [Rivibacter subsaxonicus]|uniref:50S ribosomal protein L16 3-hydroxylase n=1 Tax=Rivibacter subsaxonicus TaxID=457575 RepID=A0A4Q7VNF0_9BURK|nr:cupin domain-containing protein [Rivibacter subsaxonicus]RZT97881.1 50S ribosomal protein L16 3-hydroxylase [Rivibacter subsaxonicus]
MPQPELDTVTPLLAGLSPRSFMRRHWHKRPLLIRGAVDVARPFVDRAALFALAAREDVESRLVEQRKSGWQLRHGPFERGALPPVARAGWSLLVQGVDQQLDAAHELLARFRFVPDARLDDLMVSWASDGGGVGPHFDSYDVFLLQLQGRRRWRIGRLADPELLPELPLKILANFEAEEEFLLEAGDMLYLPPRWAHDGVAEGECLTASIGFRAPTRDELARALIERMLDDEEDDETPDASPRFRDPSQVATSSPADIPARLQIFAAEAVARRLRDADAIAIALGEWLTEPKPNVWFEAGAPIAAGVALALDRRTRMLYDSRHVFINGESWRAAGADARLLRALADTRRLEPRALARASVGARELLARWCKDGWLRLAEAMMGEARDESERSASSVRNRRNARRA